MNSPVPSASLPMPATPSASQEAEALLGLLARLSSEFGMSSGAEALKAAIAAAGRALPAGDPRPWDWLHEAAPRVGLRVSRLERPWADVRQLLETGPLLARGAAGWVLLGATSPGALQLYRPGPDAEASLSTSELLKELGATEAGQLLNWAVVEELAPAAPASPGAPVSPARRLLRLVAPERRELKTLIVFSLAVGLLNLATPVAVEALVNTVAFVGLLQPIVVLALVLAACLGLAAVLRALEAVVVELIQRRVFVRVAADLAYRLPRVRRDALERVHGPELVNRFFDVTTVQKVGSKLLLDGVTAILSAAIGLLVLAFYHPLLLAFDVVLLAALVVIVVVMGRGAVKTAIKESSAKYAVADWLEELLRHPLAFHLEGGRAIALDHADTLATTYLERRRTHYRVVLRQLVGALALQVFTSTLLLGLGGWLVKIGELTLGQLVASWLIVSLVLAAVAKLGRQLEGVYDLLAAADKLGVLFDLPLEEEGGEEPPALSGPASLRLSGLTHRWSDGGTPFAGVDLTLAPGEKLALEAPSGAGKTLLLELIHGQRPCRTGRIELDGVDLRSLRLAALRPRVGLARSGEVIAASVVENVRLGRALSLAEVRAALETVGLWETVQALPQGLETRLTSFGRPLSQGQADLLALARVIAARPPLVLVDGLLDGLDEETLARVLERLCGEPSWTLLIATRRAAVAQACDRRVRLTPSGLEEA